MMGGGFGGCTINILKKEVVEQFSAQVTEAYQHKFGKACSIYEVELADGTHDVSLSIKA